MPCLTSTLFEGGHRKCDVNFELNRPMREVEPFLSKWAGAKGTQYETAMPHLNTYCRYRKLDRSDGASGSKDVVANRSWCA